MNVLDLFAGGAGGWSLGLHRAGMRTVAACEIDPWRRDVYSHNFPAVRMYGDIRELTVERLRADGVPTIDVVAGSPPCQDASATNVKGRGIDGPETGLFLEAIRLVGEIRPRWACFENSPVLRIRGVDRVLAEMEALGYACWPCVVGADNCGAPHIRKRVWIVARRIAGHVTDCADADQDFGTTHREILGWQNAVDFRSDDVPDSDSHKLRQQSGRRRCGTNGRDQAEPVGDARHAAQDRRRAGRAGRCADAAAGLRDAARGDAIDSMRKRCGARLEVAESEEGAGGLPAVGANQQRRHDADADSHGESQRAEHGEMEGRAGVGGADQEPWVHWNRGPSAHLRMDAGLSAMLARRGGPASRIVAAYGDAIVPAIAEAIGRAILAVEREVSG